MQRHLAIPVDRLAAAGEGSPEYLCTAVDGAIDSPGQGREWELSRLSGQEQIVASRESKTSTVNRVGTQTSSKTSTSKSVSVEIRGQKLSVKSDHDPEFVERLAAHIDTKVSALQKAAPAVPLPKLLMLASMTVAEELFEARQEIDHLKQQITDRTEAMLALLEEADIDKRSPDSG